MPCHLTVRVIDITIVMLLLLVLVSCDYSDAMYALGHVSGVSEEHN